MSIAKITLTGQEIWLQRSNKSVFDLLTLPEGIEKDNVVDNIILECGEFETLYSDPSFMRSAVGVWSNRHYRTFEKWITALNIEYNPLENYDRSESSKDITDKDVGNTRTLNNEDKTTLNNEDKRTLDTTNVAENVVSAYDSSAYQPSDKVTTDDDGTITDNHTGTVTDNHTGTIKDEYSDDTTFTHSSRIHGNIGVTTSQQMLQSELDIARFNIIQEITNLFMTELCICVYE